MGQLKASHEKIILQMNKLSESIESNQSESKAEKCETKGAKLKEATYRLVARTSIYGLPRVLQTNLVGIRITWLLALAISISSCIYLLNLNIRDYKKYDVITKIEKIQPTSMIFPAVVFCLGSQRRNISDASQYAYYRNNASNSENLNKTTDFEYFGYEDSVSYNFTCMRFNGGTGPKRIANHSYTALHMHFSIPHDRYYMHIKDNNINSYKESSKIFLKNKNEHNILITRLVHSKLPEPYNNCTDMKEDTAYRQVNCIEKCSSDLALEKYNCTVISYYRVEGFELCKKKLTDIFAEFDSVCSPKCPKECESVTYEYSSTEYTDTNLSKIHIRYLELEYTEVTQTPKMTAATLISNIGGQLSLFVGIKFISLIELVEFMVETIEIFF